MTEPSPGIVDLAWNAANAANEAFDRLKGAEANLNHLRLIGQLGITGITISEDAYTTLEDRRRHTEAEFNTLVDMAAPVMLMPDSLFVSKKRNEDLQTDALVGNTPEGDEAWLAPQRILLSGHGVERLAQREYRTLVRELGEKGIIAARIGTAKAERGESDPEIFSFGAPARAAKEMVSFARMRGYDSQMTTRLFNILLMRAKETTKVSGLSNYAAPEISAEGVTIVEVEGSSYGFDEPGNESWGFDIDSLYRSVKKWLVKNPKIRNFGDRSISFLADYLNHALPEIEEPLSVTYPPDQRVPTAEKMEALEPRQLLFDTVDTGGKEELVVTHVSARRFLVSKGFNPQQTSSLAHLFDSLALIIDPSRGHPTYSYQSGGDLLYAGSYQNTGSSTNMQVWGIRPERFISLIEEAEDSPQLRRQLDAYTSFSRPLIGDYVATLKEFLASQI